MRVQIIFICCFIISCIIFLPTSCMEKESCPKEATNNLNRRCGLLYAVMLPPEFSPTWTKEQRKKLDTDKATLVATFLILGQRPDAQYENISPLEIAEKNKRLLPQVFEAMQIGRHYYQAIDNKDTLTIDQCMHELDGYLKEGIDHKNLAMLREELSPRKSKD